MNIKQYLNVIHEVTTNKNKLNNVLVFKISYQFSCWKQIPHNPAILYSAFHTRRPQCFGNRCHRNETRSPALQKLKLNRIFTRYPKVRGVIQDEYGLMISRK